VVLNERIDMKMRLAGVVLALGSGLLFFLAAWSLWGGGDPMWAVGGRDVYVQQRREALERLRVSAEAIPDSEMREREVDAIERQLRELETEFQVDEIGPEARVERQ
jgi:hypothetical protein